jgi:zona occludens toxin (predicted ATPase)
MSTLKIITSALVFCIFGSSILGEKVTTINTNNTIVTDHTNNTFIESGNTVRNISTAINLNTNNFSTITSHNLNASAI